MKALFLLALLTLSFTANAQELLCQNKDETLKGPQEKIEAAEVSMKLMKELIKKGDLKELNILLEKDESIYMVADEQDWLPLHNLLTSALSKEDAHPALEAFITKIGQKYPHQISKEIGSTGNTAVQIATADDKPRLLIAMAEAAPADFTKAFYTENKQGSMHLTPAKMLCNPMWSDTGVSLLKAINEKDLPGLDDVKQSLKCN